MAAATTILISRVRGFTKSTSTETSDADVASFVNDGGKWMLNSIPNELRWFASSDTSVTNDAGVAVDPEAVLGVFRNRIACRPVSAMESYAYSTGLTATSLKKASAIFPVYYIESGKVFIKPAPTTGAAGKVVKVSYPSIGTTDTSWVLNNYDTPAIRYAASKDFEGLAAYYMNRAITEATTIVADIETALTNFANALPTWSSATFPTISTTAVADALLKAQNLVDNLGSIDVESFLTDDDPEMVGVTVQSASQEVRRAEGEIGKLRLQLESFNVETAGEAQEFQSNLAKARSYLEEAQVRIAAINKTQEFRARAELSRSQAQRQFEIAQAELQGMIENNSKILGLKLVAGRGQSE